MMLNRMATKNHRLDKMPHSARKRLRPWHAAASACQAAPRHQAAGGASDQRHDIESISAANSGAARARLTG